MSRAYPYVLNNGKIGQVLEAVGNAARPPRFSYEFLRNIGFPSSNDRAFVSVFRHLGLITENGAPTSLYDEIRDPVRRPLALGEAVRQGYADLFAINTDIHKARDAEIRSAIARLTGKDAEYVGRAYNTFKSLVALSEFDASKHERPAASADGPVPSPAPPKVIDQPEQSTRRSTSLHYNIEIHLPATTDISVYNAIFKSLRDTLGIS